VPKLSDIRRVIPEDFSKEDREVAEKIGGSYNDFADEVYQTLNGRLDFENMARAKVSLDITFDSNGNPVGSNSVSSKLSFVSMVHVGKIQNITNSSARLASAPYIDWTYTGNGIIRINYGRGFATGNKYRLTLELVQ
jgi:hypothetical protein